MLDGRRRKEPLKLARILHKAVLAVLESERSLCTETLLACLSYAVQAMAFSDAWRNSSEAQEVERSALPVDDPSVSLAIFALISKLVDAVDAQAASASIWISNLFHSLAQVVRARWTAFQDFSSSDRTFLPRAFASFHALLSSAIKDSLHFCNGLLEMMFFTKAVLGSQGGLELIMSYNHELPVIQLLLYVYGYSGYWATAYRIDEGQVSLGNVPLSFALEEIRLAPFNQQFHGFLNEWRSLTHLLLQSYLPLVELSLAAGCDTRTRNASSHSFLSQVRMWNPDYQYVVLNRVAVMVVLVTPNTLQDRAKFRKSSWLTIDLWRLVDSYASSATTLL